MFMKGSNMIAPAVITTVGIGWKEVFNIYQRNINLYTMGSHLNVTFVNTRMITKMVSIVTSRKNT